MTVHQYIYMGFWYFIFLVNLFKTKIIHMINTASEMHVAPQIS